MNNKYVFILSPPFSGSTLLTSILEIDSNTVSLNNHENNKEGQFIEEVKSEMRTNAWDNNKIVDWHFVKEIWLKNWDLSKHYLVEKSPPNLCRAQDIQINFTPSYFLILIRNPYAFVEGKLRRDLRIRGTADTLEAIKFWIFCARSQMSNVRELKHTLLITYEDLCDKTEYSLKSISQFLPKVKLDLNSIDLMETLISNKSGKGEIINLNRKKIKILSTKQKRIISEELSKDMEVMNFFNYKLIK